MALTHSTITKRLKSAVSNCQKTALSADENLFFTNFNNKWSIAGNLIHLVKSVHGLNKAYAMPKEQLLGAFGKPTHKPIENNALFQRYKAVLATNPFNPKFAPENTEGDTKASIIAYFETQHAIFIGTLNNFTEEELDNYQIPHPALGNLTVREMYYFTIFHIEHHRQAMEKLAKMHLN
jgi:DinB superfamily